MLLWGLNLCVNHLIILTNLAAHENNIFFSLPSLTHFSRALFRNQSTQWSNTLMLQFVFYLINLTE